jgi:hypothetical protein
MGKYPKLKTTFVNEYLIFVKTIQNLQNKY